MSDPTEKIDILVFFFRKVSETAEWRKIGKWTSKKWTGGVDRIELAHVICKWQAVVKTVMNFRIL